ncbi:MAG TPA: SulP family inorganic anion transporter [Steroidobacteraceae bacterium]|nr:SulP family inorganic anion transporter [Steroidobacteraceae bacterium]
MIALLEAHRAGLFKRGGIWNNIVAGVVVGVVAMPLAMAFAIASGAKPEQGLYTAIVAGLATSLLGGTRVQISGPTGAFIAVLAGISTQYGIDGLQVATLMAGLILLAMGAAQLGAVIKFIPDPVIVGFTSGIGVIIFVGQWKDFLGLHPAATGVHFHEKVWQLLQAMPQLDVPTAAVGVLSLFIIVVGTRIFERIPGLRRVPAPLIAMLVAVIVCSLLHLHSVATIGTTFGAIPRALPSLHWPSVSTGQVLQLVGPAFAIAMLGAIESLLTAVVADGMAGTRHNSNQELIGQGAANILAPLFGGFAATGAIARTATSIRNGATSPLAGVVHVVFLVLVIVVFAPWASDIPLAALAAILFFVAWNMSDIPHFVRLLRRAPRSDKLVLVMTFGLTVFVDLVVAVNVGVIIAALLFMRRMAQSVSIQEEMFAGRGPDDPQAEPAEHVVLPKSVLVYRIDGPLFFGAAEKLERTLERMQTHIETVVIRLGRVPFMDATGMQTLVEIIERYRRQRILVILCGIHPALKPSLEDAGVLDLVGERNICASMQDVAARIA